MPSFLTQNVSLLRIYPFLLLADEAFLGLLLLGLFLADPVLELMSRCWYASNSVSSFAVLLDFLRANLPYLFRDFYLAFQSYVMEDLAQSMRSNICTLSLEIV